MARDAVVAHRAVVRVGVTGRAGRGHLEIHGRAAAEQYELKSGGRATRDCFAANSMFSLRPYGTLSLIMVGLPNKRDSKTRYGDGRTRGLHPQIKSYYYGLIEAKSFYK